MRLVKLFSLAFLMCSLAIPSFAAVLVPNPTGISLNTALNELGVVVELRYDRYPFVQFAAAPDARTIAVVINSSVAPKDSELGTKAVVIDVANRRSSVAAIVTPLDDNRLRNRQAREMKFISENLLRIEFTSQFKNDESKRRIHRTYEFFDVKTKKQFSIEEELGFDHVSDVRALGKYHYMVRHFEKGQRVSTAVYYDPVEDVLKILDTPDEDTAHAVRNANGFVGEDIWAVGEKETFVHINLRSPKNNSQNAFTYFMGTAKARLLPGHIGAVDDEDGTFVLNGHDARTLQDDDYIEYSKDAEKLEAKWAQPKEGALWPPFHQVGRFLVGDFSSYPQYGWVRLDLAGDKIELITHPNFHLVYSQVLADRIVGIGQYDVLARDITFYMVPVEGKMGANVVQVPAALIPRSKPRPPVEPIKQTLPVVSSVEDGRFLFVQVNLKSMIIIDTKNSDSVVQRIELLDPVFTVKHINEKETLIHYPKIKQVVSYERGSFDEITTMEESECEHLLNPRE